MNRASIKFPTGISPEVLPLEDRESSFFLDRYGKPYTIIKCKDGYFRGINENGELNLDEVLCEKHQYFHEVQRNADGTVIKIIIPTSC